MLMLEELRSWPEKMRTGAQLGDDFYASYNHYFSMPIKNIIFVGMGGSGIAGRLVSNIITKKTSLFSTALETPSIPAWCTTETLAFVVSYSGSTWETVQALKELTARFIPTVVLAHGGVALEIAQSKKIPFMILPSSLTPRTALGSFLGFMLTVLDHLDLIEGKQIVSDLLSYLSHNMHSFETAGFFDAFLSKARNRDFFHIWGVSGDSAPAAFRAQTQFNENSKVAAVTSFLPEANHNLLASFAKQTAQPLVLLFSTIFLPTALMLCLDSMEEVIQEAGVALYKPPLLGDTWEKQLFHIIVWADFASYYLAKQRGVEAMPVELIERLKEKNRRRGF